MTLTENDLGKIKAVVDSRADLQDQKFERRFSELEQRMATKDDLRESEGRVLEKIDQVKTMLEEDQSGVVEDVENLKGRVTKLETSRI